MNRLLLLMVFNFSLAYGVNFPTPSEKIDVKKYTFTIEVNDSTDVIAGNAEITFAAKKGLSEFEFDLINKAADKGMEVVSVSLNNKPLKFRHQGDRLVISTDVLMQGGEKATIKIVYKGVPKDGLIISKNKYGDRTFFADNWPDRGRNWIPVVDHPSDKAQVEWIIVAPVHYEVVANGTRTEESFLNTRQKLTRYVEDAEISTKVMVIGIARLAVQQSGVVKGVPVESWVYPQNRLEGFLDYAVATKVLSYFIENIGPYSYKKLANVQSKTTFGGLENASAIFYYENSITGQNKAEGLIAHEIAHQWFGDSASELEWQHVWLSEGFATYFALLYMEATYGEARRQSDMKEDREQVIKYSKKSLTPVVDNSITSDWMKVLNTNTYQKGSWVLHMLRKEIGTDKFWEGIRLYYQKFQNSNAMTSDFQRIMEQVSGKDLGKFFSQWIYNAGHPVLTGSWSYDEASKSIEIDIRQLQKSQIFTVRLEVGITFPGEPNPRVETVVLDKEIQKLKISAPSRPSKIELDPLINTLFEGNLKN